MGREGYKTGGGVTTTKRCAEGGKCSSYAEGGAQKKFPDSFNMGYLCFSHGT